MSLNQSKRRSAILSFLHTRKDHPTAEIIYENVKEIIPSISLGTVYRNLNLLSELGEIKSLQTRDNKIHYDADTSNHQHFICNRCKQISDIFIDMSPQLKIASESLMPGKMLEYEVYYYGICKQCEERDCKKTDNEKNELQ
ncbi:MAG: transcriptional repressor [Lachnospiraceae bacterium]